MTGTVTLGAVLTTQDVVDVAAGASVVRPDGLASRLAESRRLVEAVVDREETVYGVTTGFGYLANVRVPASEAEAIQRDIVRSHATAVGPLLDDAVVRAMLLLKARTFAFGISGVRVEIVDALVRALNERLHPAVPAQGSLGASGDLALLAHLALPLMGEGHIVIDGEPVPAADVLRERGIEPLRLSYKEGLSLVNGTEAMLALGILALHRAETLLRAADVTGAMSLEACLGTDRAFDDALIDLRTHEGARVSAANLRALLAGSDIMASHRDSAHLVQDAYSFRCMPQVHGAYRDGVTYVRRVLEDELASAIDNPSVLVAEGRVASSGNFHGESLAVALDHLKLCVAGLGTIAERRIARLVDPSANEGLPAFLTDDPGRRSGFMLAQYTAASLVSESRALCFPNSADTIPTSAGQEDHVSMGMTSARTAAQIVANTERVLAIEALAAAQGLDLRAPLSPGPRTGAARDVVRSVSPRLVEDRSLAPDIERVAELVRAGALAGDLS